MIYKHRYGVFRLLDLNFYNVPGILFLCSEKPDKVTNYSSRSIPLKVKYHIEKNSDKFQEMIMIFNAKE